MPHDASKCSPGNVIRKVAEGGRGGRREGGRREGGREGRERDNKREREGKNDERGALEHMSGVRETNCKLNPIVLILIRAMFKNWACRPTICAMAWATPRTIPAGGMANFRSSGTQL